MTGSTSGAGVTNSGSALTANYQLQPKALTAFGYAYVTNGTSCNGDGDCGVGSTRLTSDASVLVDETFLMYAHGFDDYGNYKGAAAGNWTNTGLSANFTPGLTGTSSLAAVLIASTPTGVPGHFSYSCTNLSAGCVGDATGNITVTAGQLHYVVTYPTTGIVAGQQFTVTVTAKDTHDNLVTSYAGAQAVTITGVNTLNSPEDDVPLYPSGQQTLTFTAGVATFNVKLYKAGTANAQFIVAQTSPSIFGTGPVISSVAPSTLDHYSTHVNNARSTTPYVKKVPAKAVTDMTYANVAVGATWGSRFDLAIYAHDVYGNTVDMSASPKTLAVSMVQNDKTTAVSRPLLCADNTNTCLSGISFGASSGAMTVTNLAYDVGGDFYIVVTDGTALTKLAGNVSDMLSAETSRYTVDHYLLTVPATATAGVPFSGSIKAIDSAGGTVFGADTDLSSMTYAFTDSAGTALNPGHDSPNGSHVTAVGTGLSFGAGNAAINLTLVKAESITLKVTDNQTSVKSGTAGQATVVSGSSQYVYEISAVDHATQAVIANGATRNADPSPAARMDITVTAKDNFGNLRPGEASIFLTPVVMSGTLDPYPLVDASNVRITNDVTGGIMVDVSSGSDTLTDVWYAVPQEIQFTLVGSAGTVSSTPDIIFQQTIHTVDHYAIWLASATPVAGQPVAATIYAMDRADNPVQNIETALNAQTFSWSGPNTSPAPTNKVFVPPTLTFNASGIATPNITFYKAETINGDDLRIVDNHSQAYLGNRDGRYRDPINVSPDVPDVLRILPTTVTPLVGSAFNVSLEVFDHYSNDATSFTQDDLTWAWSGASNSVSNPKTATSFAPVLPADGTVTFTAGAALKSGLKLFRTLETPTLTVTGTSTATYSGAPLSATRVFTPVILPGHGYALITNGTGCNGNGDCGAASTHLSAPQTIHTEDNLYLYSHTFDAYGNYKGMSNGTWSVSGLSSTFSPVGAVNNTVLSPTAPSAGTISLACSGLTAGCVGDTSGTVTIVAGVMHYDISYSTATPTVGTPFTVTITVQDTNNNVVTTYTGPQTLTITPVNAQSSPEYYGASVISGVQSLTFTAGVATFPVTLYSAGSYNFSIQATQSTPQAIFGSGPDITSVTAGSLHHYRTEILDAQWTGVYQAAAKSTPDATYAGVGTGGSRFRTRIFGTDQWGNALDLSGANAKTLTVSLSKSSGVASTNPLQCSDGTQTCLSSVSLNSASGWVDVPQLAYDLGGIHYVKATDGTINTLTSASTPITFTTSKETVHHYALTAPTNAAAGTAFIASVSAVDNSGATITGADGSLSGMTFAWKDSGGTALSTGHIAPDTTSVPSVSLGTFASGSASAVVTLYKAETLTLKVFDNQGTPITGTASNATIVAPSAILNYEIASSRGASATGIAADTDGRFDLTITAYDPYKNSRAGDAGAILMVNRVSGAANTGILEGTSNTVLSGGLIFNALSGSATISNAYYRTAQTVNFTVAGTGGTVTVTPSHSFTSTVHSVASYAVSHGSTATAGAGNLAVSVTALDPVGNTVTGIDAALNAQGYTWSGALTSPAPASVAPAYQTTGFGFSGGVATVTHGLKATQAAAALTLTDNHSYGGLGNRSGTSSGTVNVSPAIAANYTLSAASATPAAGAAFNVTVAVTDQFSNPQTAWASDTLTFAWSAGASASVANPKNGALTESHLSAGSRSFSAGSFTSTGTPFTLYRAGEATTLTVTGTSTATLSSAALTATLNLTPTVAAATGYVLVTDNVNCGTGLGLTCSTGNVFHGSTGFTMTTDQSKNLYAHGFDPYGNYKALTNVNWTGTGELAGKVSPATNFYNTLFTPTVATTTSRTLSADCSALSGCVSETTGPIDVFVGNFNKISFINSTISGTTDGCYTVTVQTQDTNSNPVTVLADTTITLSNLNSTPATNDGKFYTTNTCTTQLPSSQAVITTGSNQVTFYFSKATVATATDIKAVTGSMQTTQTEAIAIGVLNKIAFTTSALNQVATSACGTVTFVATDNTGNTGTLPTGPTTFTLSTSSTSTAGVFYSDSGCSTPLTGNNPGTIAVGAVSSQTVYYKDTKAGTPTIQVAATLAGGAASKTQSATVTPAAFDFTTIASGAKVRDTVAVTWAASAGAKDYVVSWGTNTACSTGGGTATVTAPTVTTNLTAGYNNTYYVCVTARGWDSNLPSLTATGNTTYNLIIDNTAPTTPVVSVPASGITDIGPLTVATGASGGTTTLSGTASDSGGSSLTLVEVQLVTGGTYWNGTTFVGSSTWLSATGTTAWSYAIANTAFTDGLSYTLNVRSTDGSGNVSSTQTKTFTWDASAPTATLSGAPVTYSNGAALNVTVAGTGVINYLSKVNFNAGSAPDCTAGSYSSSTPIATLITTSLTTNGDGYYIICVKGIDQAENVQSSPTSSSFRRDTVAPSVSVGTPSTVYTNGTYDLSTAATPPSGSDAISAVTYAWTITSVTGTGADCSSTLGTHLSLSSATVAAPTITVSGCTFGTFALRLTVTDAANNSSNDTLTFTWGQLKNIAFTTAALNQAASSGCGTVTFRVTDKNGNTGTLPTGPTTFTLSTISTSTAGTFYSDSGCTTPLSGSNPATISLGAVSSQTVYYSDTKAGTPTIQIGATLAGGATTITQVESITSSSFNFTTVASGTKVKDTVAVTWSASTGAKDYLVAWGTNTACSTGGSSTTVTAPTVTANLTAGYNNTYYVCVTARGWDSNLPALAATGNTTYNLIIDNTAPTTPVVSIPASGITNIGPVTVATGASGGTTTLSGTASDSGGSSLTLVEVQLETGGTYWNGSTFVGSSTWLSATGTTAWSYAIANTAFTDGQSYTLNVRSTDGSGNVSSTQTKSFTWDASAPTATLSGEPVTYSNGAALNVTVAGTGVINYLAKVNFNAGSAPDCTTGSYSSSTAIATLITTSLTTNGDGYYIICVKGIDQAENVQSSPTSSSFRRDTVAPSVSVGSPSSVSTNGSYDLSIAATPPSASDAVSAVTYAWTITSVTGTGANCSSTLGTHLSLSSTTVAAPTITVSGCTYGIFALRLTATDGAANSANATLTFTWDTRSPTVASMAATQTTQYWTTGSTVDIDVTFSNVVYITGTPTLTLNTTPSRAASYLSGSGSTVIRFRYTVQSGDNTAVSGNEGTAPNTPYLNPASTSGLALSGGTIRDSIGTGLGSNSRNGNDATLTVTTTQLNASAVVIDTYLPDATSVTFTSGQPTPQGGSNNITPSFAVASADLASFQWAVQVGTTCVGATYGNTTTYSGTPTTVSGSTLNTAISGLAQGDVVFCVRGTDRAGNVQTSPTYYTWVKDTVAPNVPTLNAPTTPAYSSTPTAGWSAPDGDVNVLMLYISKTNSSCASPVQSYTSIAGNAVTQALTLLADGGYYACLYAYDLAGNQSSVNTYQFQVETDTVHLAYATSTGDGKIRYGRFNSGSFTLEDIATASSGQSVSPRLSLALNSGSVPFVAYRLFDGTNYNVYVSDRTGGAWTNTFMIPSKAGNDATNSETGQFPTIALDGADIFYSTAVYYKTTGTTDTIRYMGYDSLNSNAESVQFETDTSAGGTGKILDVTMAIDADNAHYVYSYYNGSNWVLRYRKGGVNATNRYETIPLAAACTDAKYVQASIESGATTYLAIAYACVTNETNTPCKIYYAKRDVTTSVGTNGTPTTGWGSTTSIGTSRATCSVANLTRSYKPGLVTDRVTSQFSHLAWYDYDGDAIKSSSNESGSWSTESAVTGLTAGNAGEPTIALDATGRSYIFYRNASGAYMVTNNGRVGTATSGGWSSAVTVEASAVTGVGTAGVTGMKGVSNNSNQ